MRTVKRINSVVKWTAMACVLALFSSIEQDE